MVDMALYNITLYLAFVAAGFPAGVYSSIWTQISGGLTVPVTSISLLRAMIAAGGVLACILSVRTSQKRERIFDLCLAGVSLETLGVIGLALSRMFWHLCLWSLVLGLGLGMSLTLLCIVVIRHDQRTVMLQFSGTGVGAFAGSWILSAAMSLSGSWRTGCELLGLVQILTAFLAFFIRRSLIKGQDMRRKLDDRSREIDIFREQERRRVHVDEAGLRRAEKEYITRSAFSCAAAFLSGVLTLCMVLWPQSYRVIETGAAQEMTGYGVLMVSLGIAAGRVLAGAFRPEGRVSRLIWMGTAGALLLLEQYLIHIGGLTDRGMLFFQLFEGITVGPVFPKLLLLDDVRLDREAETALLSLLPAFALGAVIVVTPLTQALVGAGQTRWFPLWLLVVAACLGVCLFFGVKDGKD